jgi:hypothetical protein
MPWSAQASIESAGTYLRAHTESPLERLRALHDYVIDRVGYEVDPYPSSKRCSQAECAFSGRLADSWGYARLLTALGQVADVPIDTVSGVSTVGDARGMGGPWSRHAWNRVCLDHHAYFIDATLDAGEVVPRSRHVWVFAKRPDDTYFLKTRGSFPDHESDLLDRVPRTDGPLSATCSVARSLGSDFEWASPCWGEC